VTFQSRFAAFTGSAFTAKVRQIDVSLNAHRRSRASLEESLMNTRNVGILASLALVAGARAANADTAESPWGIAVYGGDSVTQAGSLRSPLSTTIPDLGTVNPALSGTSGHIVARQASL
jgi:hypothetical protein